MVRFSQPSANLFSQLGSPLAPGQAKSTETSVAAWARCSIHMSFKCHPLEGVHDARTLSINTWRVFPI